jgi:hypothetical protein
MTGWAGVRLWRIGAGSRGVGNWVVSLAATAASTYALDATATVAGIYLVASGLLAALNHQWLLAFLVASYALWGFGLRANLRANWMLLETTGTSTNVLSKAAYDMARRRTSNAHTSRRASAVGYIGTEAAKELPYYTAALGAAVFSDSIGAREALIFLGGTNLGAALYEYGLARLTTAFLRRDRRRSASFRQRRKTDGVSHRPLPCRRTKPDCGPGEASHYPLVDRRPDGAQPPTTRTDPPGSRRHRTGQDHPSTGPLGQDRPPVDREVLSARNG